MIFKRYCHMYLISLNAETVKSKIFEYRLSLVKSNSIKFGVEKSGETWNLTATYFGK